MAARIILRYPATCRDCGATLQPGQPAKYYGRGRVYGIDCHSKPGTADIIADKPKPLKRGEYERYRDGLQAMTDLDGQYEDRSNDWAERNL